MVPVDSMCHVLNRPVGDVADRAIPAEVISGRDKGSPMVCSLAEMLPFPPTESSAWW